MGVDGQRHTPAALPPGKTRYPLYRRLGGPEGLSGRMRKKLGATGIRSPDRSTPSESLYWLSYRSSVTDNTYRSNWQRRWKAHYQVDSYNQNRLDYKNSVTAVNWVTLKRNWFHDKIPSWGTVSYTAGQGEKKRKKERKKERKKKKLL